MPLNPPSATAVISRSTAGVLLTFVLLASSALADDYLFTRLAGFPDTRETRDGTGSQARFQWPSSLALDRADNVFVVDGKLIGMYVVPSLIRKVTPLGEVSTLALEARRGIRGLTIGVGGTVYFTSGHAIQRAASDGGIITVAGDPDVPGLVNGAGTIARFYDPLGITVDATGRLFVADYGNDAIRMIMPDGNVSTVADLSRVTRPNIPFEPWLIDGKLRYDLHGPQQVIVNAAGDLLVNDRYEDADGYGPFFTGIWKLTREPETNRWSSPALVRPYFEGANSMALEPSGDLMLTDRSGEIIQRISINGDLTRIAGKPRPYGVRHGGSLDGLAADASFNQPTAIAVDSSGNLYITDSVDRTLRKGILLSEREPDARITNFSIRGTLSSGNALVASFITRGDPAPLLIRGVGPGLVPLMPEIVPSRGLWLDLGFGRTGWVLDGPSAPPELLTVQARSGAFPLAAGDTAVVLDAARSTAVQLATSELRPGTALLEWYDLGNTRLNRLSRVEFRRLDSGEGLLTGFLITGSESKAVLFHAHTESRNRHFDVAYESDAVRLSLHDSRGQLIAQSTSSSPGLTPLLVRLGAFAPGELGESVLIHALPPGAYTLHASRQMDFPGSVILAMYELR